MSKKNMDCRQAAIFIITKVSNKHASLATLIPEYIKKIPEADHALLHELCYGSLRHYFSLRSAVTKYLEKPLRSKDNDVLALLILGAYQLLYTRIPDHAAINTAVHTAETMGKGWSKGLVNAILRNIQRNREELRTPDRLSGDESYYDHPQWLINKVRRQYPDRFDSILRANNEKAPLTLRINVGKTTRDHCASVLQSLDIPVETTAISPYGIRVGKSIRVTDLQLFNEGFASVQDEAAQLVAPLLGLSEGFHVLDACAAPGGKTGQILELQPSTKATAIDRDPARCELINDNLRRLQLRANIFAADASKPAEWWQEYCHNIPFDRILVDAPCSASGVIRHHPDIKLLRRPEDIEELHITQLKILHALWPLLKPDGILLYTTCSILEEENDGVINLFINREKNACAESIDASWGIGTKYGRQLLPTVGAHDGFYFSKIRKL